MDGMNYLLKDILDELKDINKKLGRLEKLDEISRISFNK